MHSWRYLCETYVVHPSSIRSIGVTSNVPVHPKCGLYCSLTFCVCCTHRQHEEEEEEEEESGEPDAVFEGGFRVPGSIWHKLYR